MHTLGIILHTTQDSTTTAEIFTSIRKIYLGSSPSSLSICHAHMTKTQSIVSVIPLRRDREGHTQSFYGKSYKGTREGVTEKEFIRQITRYPDESERENSME